MSSRYRKKKANQYPTPQGNTSKTTVRRIPTAVGMAVRNKVKVVDGISGVIGRNSGVMGTVQETEIRVGNELKVSKSGSQRILKAEESVTEKEARQKEPRPESEAVVKPFTRGQASRRTCASVSSA